jgi:hypothetical protein
MMTELNIPLSKKKNVLMVVGAIFFVLLGVLFVYKPQNFVTSVRGSIALIRLIGIVGIVFFGACSIYGLTKLFDKRVGLTMNENGITDNTNATSLGLIKWADISAIETRQIMSTKFLLVFVTNPDEYLNRATGLKKKLLQANIKTYGTPLSITSNSLQCNFENLEQSINTYWHKYRKTGTNEA